MRTQHPAQQTEQGQFLRKPPLPTSTHYLQPLQRVTMLLTSNMYELSMLATNNYLKPSSVKQHTFTSEYLSVSPGLTGSPARGLMGCHHGLG